MKNCGHDCDRDCDCDCDGNYGEDEESAREKETGGRGKAGYTAEMDSISERMASNRPGRAWVDTLPAPRRTVAAAALAALPTDAAAAGDRLPLAIAAWSVAEPRTAAGLVEAWLATADEVGNLTPGLPAICQLAERVADALPDPEPWVARLLPELAKAMEREFDRYDERGLGLPLWPAAAEALFPAEFAPGRFTVDLGVLLSNEAAAFCRLAEGHPEMNRAVGVAEGVQRELDDWLRESFWDEETAAFQRQDEGQAGVPDFSPCGLFPLAWEGCTETMVEGLRPRATETDSANWPPATWTLWLALLRHTPHRGVVAQMRRLGLPAGASAPETAAWAVLAANPEAISGHSISSLAAWIETHGRSLARIGLACGALLVALLLGWWIIHREGVSPGTLEDDERRARQASAEGQHARAAALYGQAARRGHAAYFRYRQAGEWMHLEQYADAEATYRALLEADPALPNARLNLALAVLNQGRRAEALDLYRAFAEAEAEAYPELAARARLAAELVERQLALDRESAPAATGSREP